MPNDTCSVPADEADDSLYCRLEENERLTGIEVAPRNAFEEMMMWTKQGKVWNFPINNEQGVNKLMCFYNKDNNDNNIFLVLYSFNVSFFGLNL